MESQKYMQSLMIPLQTRMHNPQQNSYANQSTLEYAITNFRITLIRSWLPEASFFNDTIFNFLNFVNKNINRFYLIYLLLLFFYN
jgi:hypothetical protein